MGTNILQILWCDGGVKMLGKKIRDNLLREGIHEDAVKSLEEKGKCLFDIDVTRDVCF